MKEKAYKLIIVEDDPWIRDGLKQMVQWKLIGFEWVGEAVNGLKGLELCEKVKPDAAVVDISMPVMNGLDFIKQVKVKFPGLKIIIMTCHDDFIYAKQAIALGCEDYLLKNTSDLDKIEKVFMQLYDTITKEKENTESQKILRALDVHSDHMLKDEWFEYLTDESLDDDYISLFPFARRLQEEEIFLPLRIYCSKTEHKELQGLKSQLAPKLADLNGELFLHQGYLYLFLTFQHHPSFLNLVNAAAEKAEILRAMIKEAKNIPFVLYMLAPFKGLDGFRMLKSAYVQLEEQSFYTTAGSIVSWLTPFKYEDLSSTKKDVIEMMRSEIKNHSVNEAIKQIEDRKPEPNAIKQWMMEVLDLKGPLREETISWKKQLFMAATWYEAVQAFTAILNIKEKSHALRMRFEVSAAIEFIEKHYQEGTLSLNQISEHAGFAPNYFGSLFKKETGVTVVEYMNELRIEKARELAREDHQLKGYEVAEMVGIHDAKYFGRLFKKNVGMSFKKYQLMHD